MELTLELQTKKGTNSIRIFQLALV